MKPSAGWTTHGTGRAAISLFPGVASATCPINTPFPHACTLEAMRTQRRRRESNPRIKALPASAFPLGYAALKPRRGKKRNPLSDRSLIAGFGGRLFFQTTSHSLKSGSALPAPRQGQGQGRQQLPLAI